MAKVIYSGDALADLERLGEFLLDLSPESAPEALAGITHAVEILAAHPLIGRRLEGELRELVISRGQFGYLALYWFDVVPDTVRILRLRHQREAGYQD